MTSSTSNGADGTDKAVIVLFASINRSMSEIDGILSSKPAVDKATRTCDVRRYPGGGLMDSPEWFSFEVYVEAETKTGDLFCWSFDLSLRSEKWTLSRDISRQGPGGHEPVGHEPESEFDTVTYESFSELREGYEPLMSEFVRSAEGFVFPS